jgi:hypothetical protein
MFVVKRVLCEILNVKLAADAAADPCAEEWEIYIRVTQTWKSIDFVANYNIYKLPLRFEMEYLYSDQYEPNVFFFFLVTKIYWLMI